MPSGLTCIIEEGCSFEEFVWRCVQGLSLMTRLRDTAKIPEQIKPSAHYKEQAEELQKELDSLMNMNQEEIIAAFEQRRQEFKANGSRMLAEENRKRDLYDKMLERVGTWEQPDGRHFDYLKSLMREQIVESEKQLLSEQNIPDVSALVDAEFRKANMEEQAANWYETRIDVCLTDIKRARERHQKELDDVQEINEFLAKLQASVPRPK